MPRMAQRNKYDDEDDQIHHQDSFYEESQSADLDMSSIPDQRRFQKYNNKNRPNMDNLMLDITESLPECYSDDEYIKPSNEREPVSYEQSSFQ